MMDFKRDMYLLNQKTQHLRLTHTVAFKIQLAFSLLVIKFLITQKMSTGRPIKIEQEQFQPQTNIIIHQKIRKDLHLIKNKNLNLHPILDLKPAPQVITFQQNN